MVTTSCLHTPKGATPEGGRSAQQGHRCGCFKEQTKTKWGKVKIQEGACVPGPSLWPQSLPSQVWDRGAQAWGPGLGPATRSGSSPLSSEPQSLNSGFPSLRKFSSSPAELGAPWGKRLGQEEGMTRDSQLCKRPAHHTPGALQVGWVRRVLRQLPSSLNTSRVMESGADTPFFHLPNYGSLCCGSLLIFLSIPLYCPLVIS